MPNASVRLRAPLPLVLRLLYTGPRLSPLLDVCLFLFVLSAAAAARLSAQRQHLFGCESRTIGIDCTSILLTLRRSAHTSALCADELIRQVTIEGAERGLLFLRIRDEARMRIAAYQTLYESSLAFAVRKAVQGEEEKNVLEARIKEMMSDRREKLKYIAELQERADSSDAINEERWTAMKKKQVHEIKSLKELYKNQTKQLQEALAPPPGFVRPA